MARAMMANILMSIVAITMLFHLALAVDHNVGAPNGGWDTSTPLESWSSGETFTAGDNLVFTYGTTHDVLEVTKDDYDICSTSSPISTSGPSPTTIALTDSGVRYFICGTAGHCDQGMKVEIQTVPAATPPPSSDSPAPAAPPVSTDASPPNDDNAPPTVDENAPAPPVISGGSPNNTGETTNPPPTPKPSSAAKFNIMTIASIVGFGFLMMI